MTPFSKKYLRYIKVSKFLPEYCNIPYSSYTRQKINGIGSNEKPLDFTDEEKKVIIGALKKLAKDLK